MKYVLRYESAGDLDLEAVAAQFDHHRALWAEYQQAGTLLAIGPLADPRDGALGLFTTREAAEDFAGRDPFVAHGLVACWDILEWNEVLLDPPDLDG